MKKKYDQQTKKQELNFIINFISFRFDVVVPTQLSIESIQKSMFILLIDRIESRARVNLLMLLHLLQS